MKYKVVTEIVERIIDGDNVNIIAECNLIDEDGNVVAYFSRSPFTYNKDVTDELIIEDLKFGVYSIYYDYY